MTISCLHPLSINLFDNKGYEATVDNNLLCYVSLGKYDEMPEQTICYRASEVITAFFFLELLLQLFGTPTSFNLYQIKYNSDMSKLKACTDSK